MKIKKKKSYFLTFLLMFVLSACQEFVSGGSSVSFDIDNFRNDWLYAKFVGSNKTLLSVNDHGEKLWNNCIEFIPPSNSSITLTNFPTYKWRSSVFKNPMGKKQLFFPNEIITTNGNKVSLLTKSYFIIRYDIKNTFLDDYDNWVPVSDSPFFREDFNQAVSDGGDTLNGQTLFQIIYFRNFSTNISNNLREVEFNFGSRFHFTITKALDNLSPTALRSEYEKIADILFSGTSALISGLQEPFFNKYYEVTNDINPRSTHPEFKASTKTCPD